MNTYLQNKKRCSKCNNTIKKGFKIPCGHFVCEKCIIDKPKCNICKIKFNGDNIFSKKELINEYTNENCIFTKIPKCQNKSKISNNINQVNNILKIMNNTNLYNNKSNEEKKQLIRKRNYNEFENFNDTLENFENLSIQDKILYNLNNIEKTNLMKPKDKFLEKKLKTD